MRVKVKLYASLRQYAKAGQAGNPIELELPEGSGLQDVLFVLKIPEGETRIMFVNGIIQEPGWRLKDGDEIGMFPPIGGG